MEGCNKNTVCGSQQVRLPDFEYRDDARLFALEFSKAFFYTLLLLQLCKNKFLLGDKSQ